MQYIIKGVEDVYDNLDEFEHSNEIIESIVVEAQTLEEARSKGQAELQKIVNEDRFRRGFTSSPSSGGPYGFYFAKVTEIYDMDGNLLSGRALKDAIVYSW